MWRDVEPHLRDPRRRTGDMLLILSPLTGPAATRSRSPPGVLTATRPMALIGKPLTDFVHPEEHRAARASVCLVIGLPRKRASTRDDYGDSASAAVPPRRAPFSFRVRASDGSLLPVRSRGAAATVTGLAPTRLLRACWTFPDQVSLRQRHAPQLPRRLTACETCLTCRARAGCA